MKMCILVGMFRPKKNPPTCKTSKWWEALIISMVHNFFVSKFDPINSFVIKIPINRISHISHAQRNAQNYFMVHHPKCIKDPRDISHTSLQHKVWNQKLIVKIIRPCYGLKQAWSWYPSVMKNSNTTPISNLPPQPKINSFLSQNDALPYSRRALNSLYY